MSFGAINCIAYGFMPVLFPNALLRSIGITGIFYGLSMAFGSNVSYFMS